MSNLKQRLLSWMHGHVFAGDLILTLVIGVLLFGVTGSITFDQTTGDANKDMAYIKKAADGAFEFVKTQSVED